MLRASNAVNDTDNTAWTRAPAKVQIRQCSAAESAARPATLFYHYPAYESQLCRNHTAFTVTAFYRHWTWHVVRRSVHTLCWVVFGKLHRQGDTAGRVPLRIASWTALQTKDNLPSGLQHSDDRARRSSKDRNCFLFRLVQLPRLAPCCKARNCDCIIDMLQWVEMPAK